jgi:hypothetical protein
LLLVIVHHQGCLYSNGDFDPSRPQPRFIPGELRRFPDLIRRPEGAETILGVTELNSDRILGVELNVWWCTKDTWFHELLEMFPSFFDRVVETSCTGDEMEEDVDCDQEKDCVPAHVLAKVAAEA